MERLKVYFSNPDIQGIFKMSMMCVLRQEADCYINQECIWLETIVEALYK
jgi:hypothetical protein